MSVSKQYWDYTIPERVRYATGDYFKTLKDDPHLDGLTETEIESIYAAGIQWGEIFMPVYKNVVAFEATQMLLVIFAAAEYKSSTINYRDLKNRDVKMFGLSVNELHSIMLANLSGELFSQCVEEYYWCVELTLLKTSRKSDSLQGLWYKTMATNIDNYLVLRDVDGLFSWGAVSALCCNINENINELPEWHYECINAGIWAYDAINACKHRAEAETCDLSRYIDGGMPASVSNMLEYARQKIWCLNKRYSKDIKYQPYKATMQGVVGIGPLVYRYRHTEFLGPVLAKNTQEDDDATNDEKHIWYKITQDGGPVGVIKEYRKAIEMKNTDNIKSILNRNHNIKCKQIMLSVLEEDIKKYKEINFPVDNKNSITV
jgi:hypothetical protein